MKGRPRVRVDPCRFCNKQFKRQEHLQRHLRTHTQEKPFACFCGRMFSRQDLFARHQRFSHSAQPDHTPNEPARRPRPGSFVFVNEPQPRPPTSREHGSPFSPQSGDNHTEPVDGTNINFGQTTQSPPASDDAETNRIVAGTDIMNHWQMEPTAGLTPKRIDAAPSHELAVPSYDTQCIDSVDVTSMDIGMFWNEADILSNYLGAGFGLDYRNSSVDQLVADQAQMNTMHSPDKSYSGSENFVVPTTIQTPEPTDRPQPASPTQSDAPGTGGNGNLDEGSYHISKESFDGAHDPTATTRWTVSATVHDNLFHELSEYKHVIPKEFTLPGRQAMSRYLASYFRGFSPHLPFLHVPSTSPETMSPMLILALAAVGAFYGFEHPQGYSMYFASRAMLQVQLEKRRRDIMHHLTETYPKYAQLPSWNLPPSDPATSTPCSMNARSNRNLEIIQILLAFMQLTAWADGPVIHDALAMTGQLAVLIRETLMDTPLTSLDQDWTKWCIEETKRRTLFSAYIVLNLQSVCFNIPPVITNWELNLCLPCSAAEWNATGPSEWSRVRRQGARQNLSFQQCMKQLLSGKPLEKDVSVTAFGNYVLIQGLLQQIYFERQSSYCATSRTSSLAPNTIHQLAAALRAWQICWESATESTLDPASPHGPLGFNATAMLRLAHIRLSVDLSKHCALGCRDPELLAKSFTLNENPIPARCPHLHQAIVQCIHALSIPVRVGVALVARTQHGYWSVQHAISNFTCARLLTSWLENMAQLVESSGIAALDTNEKHLLSKVTSLIQETHLADSLCTEDSYPMKIRQLAVAAVQLWAETCKGIHVFEIVHVIGTTLSLVAKQLEQRTIT